MTTYPSVGERWELRRNYVNELLLPRIVKQARWITQQTAPCISDTAHHSFRRGNFLRSNTVHIEGSTRNAGRATLDQFPELIQEIPDLLNLNSRTQRDTSDTTNVFSILTYNCFGRLGWHVDEEEAPVADDSLAVNLKGSARITVIEGLGVATYLTVNPGDALYINNSGPSYLRPLHRSSNIGRERRLVLVD